MEGLVVDPDGVCVVHPGDAGITGNVSDLGIIMFNSSGGGVILAAMDGSDTMLWAVENVVFILMDSVILLMRMIMIKSSGQDDRHS